MVVVSHLFSLFWKKNRERHDSYESCLSLSRAVHFPTAPFYLLASTPGLCTEHTVSTESRMTETLRPVLTYIQKHHSESVTIEQLAKIAHMSSSYFMSCFKQNFGLGAIEYLNQVRI